MGNFSKYYNIEEFYCKGKPMPKALIPNGRHLATYILDPIREATRGPLHVSSGWRSTWRNRTLKGASKDSFHLYFMAADVWSETLEPEDLYNLILRLRDEGDIPPCGVRYYPDGRFVHVDTGWIRNW